MADVQMGTLYDMNKEIMKNQPIMTEQEIDSKKDTINQFILDHYQYFMLLCNERKDYTLFNDTMYETFDTDPYDITRDIIECLQNRGKLQSIELTKNEDAIEFWIKTGEESYCYYFFPYDEGVLQY